MDLETAGHGRKAPVAGNYRNGSGVAVAEVWSPGDVLVLEYPVNRTYPAGPGNKLVKFHRSQSGTRHRRQRDPRESKKDSNDNKQPHATSRCHTRQAIQLPTEPSDGPQDVQNGLPIPSDNESGADPSRTAHPAW